MAKKYVAPEVEPVVRSEAQKRAEVFLKVEAPLIILVKVLAMGAIPGVPRVAPKEDTGKDRDDPAIEIKHIAEAEDKGLDPFAYRDRADTGLCLFQKEEGVRVNNLLDQMWNLGYVLKDFHWQNQNKKGPVNTFEFVLAGEGETPANGKRLPPEAVRVLTQLRFNHCTIWCNMKENEQGQFRLDTINLAKGRETDEPSRQLNIVGRTYRLY